MPAPSSSMSTQMQPAAVASLTADVKVGFHPGRHCQGAASVHCLKGIFHQIEKNLRQLGAVAADRAAGSGRIAFFTVMLCSGRGLRFEQEHVFQDLVDIDRREFQLCRPRQIKKLLDEFVYPIDFANHDVGIVAARCIAFQERLQQLRRALDSA